MQSGGFADVITVGKGDDIIYGGKASFSNNQYNGFDLNAADAAKIANNFRFVSDGDLINLSKGGQNKIVFQSKVETGFELQGAFNRNRTQFITLGTDGTQDLNLSRDLSDRNLLVGTSGQFLTSNSGTTVTQGVFSGAIGVDTLTNFNITRDQIVLDESIFTLNAAAGIQLFQGRGGPLRRHCRRVWWQQLRPVRQRHQRQRLLPRILRHWGHQCRRHHPHRLQYSGSTLF